MGPVFKNLFIGNQLMEMGGFVAGVAIPQGVVMGALNGRNRIDLDVAKVFNSRQRGCNCTTGLFAGGSRCDSSTSFLAC
jgi:hypothetical protein